MPCLPPQAGQTIEQIQKNSGARVQLSRAGEFYPGTSERVLLLSGTLHSVLTGVFLMLEKLPRDQSPPSRTSASMREDAVRGLTEYACAHGQQQDVLQWSAVCARSRLTARLSSPHLLTLAAAHLYLQQ
jgi:hypothetical protein